MADGAQDDPLPGFTERARRVVSNAALFDLVEDLAGRVDRLTAAMSQQRVTMEQILRKLPHAW